MQFIKQKEKNEKKYFSDCANYICEVTIIFWNFKFYFNQIGNIFKI